jgi:hypothetical protein
MERNDRNDQRPDAERGEMGAARNPDRDPVIRELETSGTDGKGTGGMGADAGGWEPLPEDERGA